MQCWKWIEKGLWRLEIGEVDRIITVWDIDEIEWRIIKHNKEHFSKFKGTKAHDDKTYYAMKENDTRDDVMKGELNKEIWHWWCASIFNDVKNNIMINVW